MQYMIILYLHAFIILPRIHAIIY